jgi:Fungalysin metallopeptidase (M36)/Fungalysin/Thermolysin Propeptide Motif
MRGGCVRFLRLGMTAGAAVLLLSSSPTAVAQPGPALTEARTSPRATVRLEAGYGVRSSLIRYGGYLSGPNTDVRAYLRLHSRLLRLDARRLDDLVSVQDYTTKQTGARHVFLRQLDHGRKVYGSLLKLTLDREGRVVTVSGAYFPGASAAGVPTVDADGAVRAAAGSLGAPPAPGPISAELVTFPMPGGQAARLGWMTLIETQRGWSEMVVDARSGKVLSGHSYAAYGPEGNVYTVAHPDLGSQHIVSFAGAAFDDAGWVAGTTTAGNNADAYEDLNNDDVADYQPQTPPFGDPSYQHFDYTFTNALATSGGTDITTDRNAAVTQAFYWINFLHDYYYGLGFDEAAGNFQDDNFGRGGISGDGMLVEVHNGFAANPEQSNTQTPPGQHPRMELEVNGIYDGAVDEDLIAHEYTHGVSNRLLNGEATGGGLPFGPQTWALGEGWSDFMSTSITDDPVAGEYICGHPPTGCPLYPYDASPLVYSDLCNVTNGCEPHRDGEIWTAALWDIRHALGRTQTEQLVVDGMKNTTPARASFLDARGGGLAA